MKSVWNSLRLAFSIYSILPAGKVEKNKENMQYVLFFIPLVGAIIGLLINGWRIANPYLIDGAFMIAVVSVMISTIFSGAAFLDGFFRTVDAMSSHQNREGKLAILKDPHSGYTAISTCICYFLVIVGLWSEMPLDAWPVLAFGFVISRALYGLSIVLFKHTQESKCTLYVQERKQKNAITAVMIAYIAICIFFMVSINPADALFCLIGAVLAFAFYAFIAFRYFGGITEDIASFFVQVCEIAMPLMVLLRYRYPF